MEVTAAMNLALPPNPGDDWLDQRQLAELLRVSEKTASAWARAGRLAVFEHGVPQCGRRRYSRALVGLELQRRWNEAVRRQEAAAENQLIGNEIRD